MKKILIANRGEIVARIARTCRRLNIATVAIYSDADAGQAFIAACDESQAIGGSRAEDSYLNIDNILKAAKDASADAIHPGYGFLSENAEFASLVRAAGMIFIGPDETVLLEGGEKDKARALAEKLKIPCVPGLDARDKKEKDVIAQAKKIGFPLLVKAAGGGGGRGMRRVASIDELPDALAAAGREAKAFFGNPHLLLEKLVSPARHIEVQILGDSAGNVLHFFERDCSIQRKFQKIIEESPARDIPDEIRSALHQAAISIARELKLCGAATVEFLYSPSDKAFYFLEINPRLQVEHGVTEEVCGVDLVELQIRVARGEALALRQEEIRVEGHAIEARVYAEIPQRGYIPSLGKLSTVDFPDMADLRIDHALCAGCEVGPHYDSMLAKVIGSGASFDEALERLTEGLSRSVLRGVDTNIAFLLDLLDAPLKPPPSTSFLDEFSGAELRGEFSVAAIALAYRLMEFGLFEADRTMDPFYEHALFRQTHEYSESMSSENFRSLIFRAGTFSEQKSCELFLRDVARIGTDANHGARGSCSFDGRIVELSAIYRSEEALLELHLGAEKFLFFSPSRKLDAFGRLALEVCYRGHQIVVEQEAPVETDVGKDGTSENRLFAPLPGTIAKIALEPGQSCKAGETLLILESMKTEHLLCAPRDLTVDSLHVEAGATVQQGSLLMEFAS